MSSYRGHFRDLSPSDQADLRSWTEPPEPECELCGTVRHIDPDTSQAAGLWICVECVEITLQGDIHE
jgi:hypothetical protein